MLALFADWFLGPFIPHGHCYLWRPGLVGLHVWSDSLIALSYYSIPLTLLYFVRKRRDIPFDWIFLFFGAFIVACGTTHLLEVWTLWHPNYWFSGFVKAITAAVSLCTAMLLVPLIPKALALPSPAQLEQANRQLEQQIQERAATEAELQRALQQLRFHVENTPLAVIELNNEFRVQRWSKQAETIFGWKAEEVFNQRLDEWQFVFEEDLLGVQQDMSRLLNGSQPHIFGKNRNYTKDGAVIYCEWYNSALWNQSGELISIVSFALDVTERTHAELALKDSELRYRTLVETSPDAIGVSDLDGKLLFCNRQVARLHGYKNETELLGQNVFELIALESHRVAAKNFQKILKLGTVRDVEYTMLRQDGSQFPAEFSGSLMRDAQGNPQAIIGLIRDITERKSAEDALKRAKADLAKRVEERTAQLKQVNEHLLSEIHERQLVEVALRQSEARLNQALSAAQMGAWDWDLLQRSLTWSDGVEELLGLKPGSFAGTYKAFLKCLHPVDRPTVTQALNRSIETGANYDVETRIIWPDSAIRWVAAKGAVLHNPSGQAVRMTGTVMDITKRKRVELALERERQQLRQIIASAPVAMAMLDNKMRYLAHSHKWLQLQDLEERSIIGRSHYEIFPDIPERWKAEHQRALQGEVRSASEDVWERIDGTKVYLRWAIHPWYTPDGEIGGIVIATDRINELVEAREAALEAARIKTEFLANMSHEIRTPMNGVLGTAGLLLQTNLAPQQFDYARTIRSSAEHLLNIINDILDFSKLEAGEMQLETIDFDLDASIESVVDVLAAQVQDKRIELVVLVDSNVPRQLQGDPGRLRQILLNLVGNAVKFTDSGQVLVKAALDLEGLEEKLKVQSSKLSYLSETPTDNSNSYTEQHSNLQPGLHPASLTTFNPSNLPLLYENGYAERGTLPFGEREQPSNLRHSTFKSSTSIKIRFEVTDTGIGISEADQQKLFQSFSQVDASTTRQYGGTGLGLVICKQLVELMGGEIGIESLLGQGSTFWFTASFGISPESVVKRMPSVFNQLKLLLVCDRNTTRQSVRSLAQNWGIQVEEATDSTSALKALRSSGDRGHPYDLAIVDLQLPNNQAMLLVTMIRCDPKLAQTKLIMMSASEQHDSVQELEDMDISGYLVKPVRASRLWESLVRALKLEDKISSGVSRPGDTANLQQQKLQLSPLKILLVEDHPVNQMVILNQLQMLGLEADCVGNGKEAITKLAQQNYDIVLMDCQMPVLDGYEATKELRRREGSHRHTIVIALTAHALPTDRAKCLSAGMDDYLSKPIDQDALGAMIERWAKFTTKPKIKITQSDVNSQSQLPVFNSDETPLDFQRLNAISRGKVTFQQQLVKSFIKNAQPGLEQIRHALQIDDFGTIEQQAHRIKGASANVGVRIMPEVAAQLERQAREKTLEGAAERLEALERQLEEVKIFVESWCVD